MKVLFFSLFIVIADQFSKIFIKGINIPFLNINIVGMTERQSINVIGDFFKITCIENPGMAFSIGVSSEIKILLSLFSLAASIGIIYYIYKSHDQRLVLRIALAFILGGAVGNFIDRAFYGIIYGYAPLFFGNVVDFIKINITFGGFNYRSFPIFNVADSAVCIGVFLLLILNILDTTKFGKKIVNKDFNLSNNDLNARNTK